MKALSVRQPWASLIASGAKSIEIRTWRTRYRGPLLIVSASSWATSAAARCFEEMRSGAPRGVSICLCELVDVRPAVSADGPEACCDVMPQEFAWVLRDVRAVPHVPFSGRLGLIELPDFAEAAIRWSSSRSVAA